MASANDGLDAVIADVLDDIGAHERASWVRANIGTADVVELADSEQLDALRTLLDKIPASNARHTHNDSCHTVRAQCLAEKIRDILDGSE